MMGRSRAKSLVAALTAVVFGLVLVAKNEVTREEVASMMAGGEDMETLSAELAEFERTDAEQARRGSDTPEPPEGRDPAGNTQEEERS